VFYPSRGEGRLEWALGGSRQINAVLLRSGHRRPKTSGRPFTRATESTSGLLIPLTLAQTQKGRAVLRHGRRHQQGPSAGQEL